MYSSNGTLKSLIGVWFLTKAYHSNAFFLPTSKNLIWSLGRKKYEGILALRILLSQTMDPRRKMSYNQNMMCMCVENL